MRRTRRARLLGAGALVTAVAVLVSACGGSSGSSSSGGGKEVKLAVLAPSSLLWLHAIAKDQGFYGKHGVSIKEIQIQSSSALVQAVSSGSADAGVALGDNTIRAIDQGARLTISGAILSKAVLRLYSAKGVSDVAGMKGGKVTAGAVAGGTSDLMLHQLEQLGLSKDDVELAAITNSSDRVLALQNGQVKGALLIPPFDTLAEEAGATRLDWYDKPYVETPLVLNTAWAKKNKAAAKGVTQALRDAAEWIYRPENKDKAVSILAGYTKTKPEYASKAYDFMVTEAKAISPDLSVPPEGLTNIMQVTADVTGKPLGDFDPSKYVDASYLAD